MQSITPKSSPTSKHNSKIVPSSNISVNIQFRQFRRRSRVIATVIIDELGRLCRVRQQIHQLVGERHQLIRLHLTHRRREHRHIAVIDQSVLLLQLKNEMLIRFPVDFPFALCEQIDQFVGRIDFGFIDDNALEYSLRHGVRSIFDNHLYFCRVGRQIEKIVLVDIHSDIADVLSGCSDNN